MRALDSAGVCLEAHLQDALSARLIWSISFTPGSLVFFMVSGPHFFIIRESSDCGILSAAHRASRSAQLCRTP